MGQPVVSWQMITKNPDRVNEFYTRLFGWKSNSDNALGYRMIDTGSERGINGGIWPAPPQASSFVQLFIEVDDMARYVDQATQLGAKVLIPPQKLPDGDEMAIMHDPEGMSFGIVKPA